MLHDGAGAPDFRLDGAEPPHPGVFMGCELLDRYDPKRSFVEKGATLRVFTLKETRTGTLPFNAYHKDYTVVGRFRTGMAEYDSGLVYMPLRAAQDLLNIGDSVTHLTVRLDDYTRAPAVVKAIRNE